MKRFFLVAAVLVAVPAVAQGQIAMYCGEADDLIDRDGSTNSDGTVQAIDCARLDTLRYQFVCEPGQSGGKRELYWRQDGETNYALFATVTVNASNEIVLDGTPVGDPGERVTLEWTLPVVNKRGGNIFRVRIDKPANGVTHIKSEWWGDLGSSKDHLEGDFNGNGKVEQADLDLVLLHWGALWPGGVSVDWLRGQPASGSVDQEEYDSVALNWGNECP